VRALDHDRDEVLRLTEIFRGHVLDVTEKTYTIELTGTGDKLDAFIAAMDGVPIVETVRSGVTGIARGEKSLGL
jgi:acetolactate synthase-1/3 small subunit